MIEKLDFETVQKEMQSHENLASLSVNDDAAVEALLFNAAPTLRTRGSGFWANVRHEFWKFLCTDDAQYEEERKAFRQRGAKATPALLGMLTGAIITALGGGILISTLVPFVSLLLYTLAKTSKNAFCETYRPATAAK